VYELGELLGCTQNDDCCPSISYFIAVMRGVQSDEKILCRSGADRFGGRVCGRSMHSVLATLIGFIMFKLNV